MPVQTQLQMRRDTAANWTSTNPTLASGEWGLETDTKLMKIGDGVTAWNSLGYQLNSLLDEDLATDPRGAYFDGTGLVYPNPNTAGNFTSAPDSAALDITGDIDIRVKVKMNDWTPAAVRYFINKDISNASTGAYTLYLNTTGRLGFQWWTSGGVKNDRSSADTGFTDGSTKWVRVTLDVDNGAGNAELKFFSSDDGSTWTQIGTTITITGTTNINNSANALGLGSVANSGNTQNIEGTLYRVQILNGIDGTTVFDADFETVPADSFAFTESSANAATVTLTTTRYSFGVPSSTFTVSGTANSLNNTTWYLPFRLSNKPITLKHIAFEAATAPASNATVRIGIYKADAQMQPTGSKLYDTGAVTVSNAAAAIYRIRITPQILMPGYYVIVFNTTVAFNIRFYRTSVFTFAPNTLGTNVTEAYRRAQNLSGDYPTTGDFWNARGVTNNAIQNLVLLGWS